MLRPGMLMARPVEVEVVQGRTGEVQWRRRGEEVGGRERWGGSSLLPTILNMSESAPGINENC